ncbi:histidine kinase [Umezawaea sp. Da 62-37]|uniref:sensor histidine kinase n=1 Tax=Umezawaea sp. Da 62-37 TaxID=3075927 RepID=UPI0028F72C56|nr:histidine kinase [Umezawaea sp. Da 62-37]WNV88363.1 histidine kinase [Umezawaea sp. Da 62-37]
MDVRQRPSWRSGVGPVTGGVFAVLVLLMVAVGGVGSAAVVVPSLLAVAAVGVAVFAVRRGRLGRAAYEERLTEWAAAQAAQAERMRIARDLHDIVSHGLGLITVRAAAARYVTGADVAEALADIENASREATSELRHMLTVLRAADDDAVPRRPVEGLDQLPAIVRGAEVAGLRTELTVEPVGEVPPGVQVAVCKVVREALNNSARHAGPTDVRVRVHRDGDSVVVAVADSGPGGPRRSTPGAGHGLIGLRERVVGLGGAFSAEPVEAGFRVTARIPDGGAE